MLNTLMMTIYLIPIPITPIIPPNIPPKSDFFNFDLGELLYESLMGVIARLLGGFKETFIVIDFFKTQQYRLAFQLEDIFGNTVKQMFSSISTTTIFFALFLIVLVFIKKGIECYILWSDGDPDISPSQLVIRFVIAIATAISTFLLYDIVLKVAGELIIVLEKSTAITMTYIDFASLVTGILATSNIWIIIFGFIFVVMSLIACFKLITDGLMLIVIKWLLPITCIGLLDNDKGLFNETWKAFIRIVATVIIRYYLLKISFFIILDINGGIFGTMGAFQYMVAIAIIGSADKVANLLTQIFVPVQQGGGLMAKAYPAMMAGNMFRSLVKR